MLLGQRVLVRADRSVRPVRGVPARRRRRCARARGAAAHRAARRASRARAGSSPLGDGLELPAPAAAAVAGDVALRVHAVRAHGPRAARAGGRGHRRDAPVTRFLVEILRAKGITPTVVAEPARAARTGCSRRRRRGRRARDADERGPRGGRGDRGAGHRRPAVARARDRATLPELAAALAGPRATLTVLAPARRRDLPGELVAREVTVIGVAGAHPDLIVEAAAMCAKGEIDLAGGTTAQPDDLMRAIATDRIVRPTISR